MTESRIHVATQGRPYDIVVGPGVLADAASWQGLERESVALVVTNATVGPLYANRLLAALRPRFGSVEVLELADGEEFKTWASVQAIIDALLAVRADRQSLLIGLGGGVVGDLTGFAASCYMRGIDYVHVPTTVLAQVDSSVGGKTGINHSHGKNLIGAFHQPVRVISDIDTLSSLSRRDVVAGLAEVIKYGVVADTAFFDWIERDLDALLARNELALTHAVVRSCEIKASVVAADEREAGLRAILNFGHTFGHAIEAGVGYVGWLHGEAVGCGMLMAADLSCRLGFLELAHARRIEDLVRRAGLPTQAPRLGIEQYVNLMRSDKKSQAGRIRFVLLDGPGRASLRSVETEALREVLLAHAA